jgi:outer membrane receptor protein involved in Fe transport
MSLRTTSRPPRRQRCLPTLGLRPKPRPLRALPTTWTRIGEADATGWLGRSPKTWTRIGEAEPWGWVGSPNWLGRSPKTRARAREDAPAGPHLRSPKRHLLRIFLTIVLVAISILAAPNIARADDVADEADHLFTLGAEHYQNKDYKNALQYFLASNRLVRNRNVMYNIARTYEHLSQPSDAYRYYQRALDGETDATVKMRIQAAMQRLGSSVALLRVDTDPAGATLYLGRKDLGDRGTSPQTIALPPGSYNVIAELAGYDDATSKAVDVRLGQEKSVTLKLTRIVGTLRVLGSQGATVRLDADDGPVLCEAPCDAAAPPGQHTLVLTKPGFRTTRQNVQIKANATTEVKPDIEAETGSLVVNADERDAVIEIDGKTRGFTPSVLTVPAGKHDLRVTLRGFRPVERQIEMKANEQTQLDLQLVSAEAVEAASRVSEPIEDAPASVSLVTSPELRSMRYPTVADAVRGLRGVYVSDDTAYKSVNFRGFGRPGDYGNRVLVLVDGHPTNDNWIGSSYVGYDLRTDLEDVERIEVVRGPGSVLYGTGAFSGVINLITHTRDTPDGREVGISTADNGMARGRVRFTHHFSKDFGVSTSVAGGRGAGRDFFFREFVADGPPSVAGNARGLDGVAVGTWTGRVFYKSLSAQWSLNHHDKNMPGGQFDVLFGDARTKQADSRGFLEVKFDPKISDQLTSVTRVHGNAYFYRSVFARNPADGGIERSTYDGAWVGAEERLIYSPIEQLRITGGGELQYHFLVHQKGSDEVNGQYYDDKDPFTLAAGYLLADLSPSKVFKASAGARLDAYSFVSPSINPRAAFIIRPYAGGNIKVMGGKAFRAPSVYELYNTARGGQKKNTDLRPENLYSAEVEYSHRFSPTVIGAVSGYANYITNLIALRDLPDATPELPSYAYQNTAVPVGTLGAEVELRREWKEGWMLGASYSFQKSRYLASDAIGDFFAFGAAPNLREVPNSPNHLASVRGGVPLLARALMLMSRFTFEGPRFDRNDAQGTAQPAQLSTPLAFLWDVVFSGSEARWGLNYGIGVYNAFDTRWTVPVSAEFRPTTVAMSGRTFLAFGSVTF